MGKSVSTAKGSLDVGEMHTFGSDKLNTAFTPTGEVTRPPDSRGFRTVSHIANNVTRIAFASSLEITDRHMSLDFYLFATRGMPPRPLFRGGVITSARFPTKPTQESV